MNIAEFLLARIAEDEGAARATRARSTTDGSWYAVAWEYEGISVSPGTDDGSTDFGELRDPDTAHITRWSPARVAAECEAKRRIVELHPISEHGHCCVDPEDVHLGEKMYWGEPCLTLRLLALPHVDHPDYDAEWKP